jgi:CobQ-like glutamine amidotransferase family enzyme
MTENGAGKQPSNAQHRPSLTICGNIQKLCKCKENCESKSIQGKEEMGLVVENTKLSKRLFETLLSCT